MTAARRRPRLSAAPESATSAPRPEKSGERYPARFARRLIEVYPDLSFTRAKRVIEGGQVSVDGKQIYDPGTFVDPAAKLVWDPHRKVERRVEGPTVELLHSDADVAVAIKPAGLLTQPTTEREKDTLLSRVSLTLARKAGERVYLAVVHRLDKDSSGLVAFATSKRGLTALQKQLEDHSMARTYEALVEGNVIGESGTFREDLAGDGTHRKRWVARPGERGKPAVTHWEVVQRFGGATHVRVRLETGRTHQIRIHFAAAGYPVVGERVYRKRTLGEPAVKTTRQALHAAELSFQHPGNGRKVTFKAPLPDDFRALVAELRKRRTTK
ncbi:MAG: RluA family pseudouridine synthase [Thermoanaerobaculia bacterium]